MKGLFETLPEAWQQIAASGIGTVAMAALGRLLWHVQEVQLRRRSFWSPHLIWELITAFCIGFLADGVASHFGLVGSPATAVIIAISYLGPRGLEAMLIRVLEAWGRKGGR